MQEFHSTEMIRYTLLEAQCNLRLARPFFAFPDNIHSRMPNMETKFHSGRGVVWVVFRFSLAVPEPIVGCGVGASLPTGTIILW